MARCIAADGNNYCELIGGPCATSFFKKRCYEKALKAYCQGINDADESHQEKLEQQPALPNRQRCGPISPSYLEED